MLAIIFSHIGHAGRQRHTEGADQPRERARALAAMSGVLGLVAAFEDVVGTGAHQRVAGLHRDHAPFNGRRVGRLQRHPPWPGKHDPSSHRFFLGTKANHGPLRAGRRAAVATYSPTLWITAGLGRSTKIA